MRLNRDDVDEGLLVRLADCHQLQLLCHLLTAHGHCSLEPKVLPSQCYPAHRRELGGLQGDAGATQGLQQQAAVVPHEMTSGPGDDQEEIAEFVLQVDVSYLGEKKGGGGGGTIIVFDGGNNDHNQY